MRIHFVAMRVIIKARLSSNLVLAGCQQSPKCWFELRALLLSLPIADLNKYNNEINRQEVTYISGIANRNIWPFESVSFWFNLFYGLINFASILLAITQIRIRLFNCFNYFSIVRRSAMRSR